MYLVWVYNRYCFNKIFERNDLMKITLPETAIDTLKVS